MVAEMSFIVKVINAYENRFYQLFLFGYTLPSELI